jgi:transposase
MEVLWLKSKGLPHKEIVRIANVCDKAVTRYLRLYQNGGLDEVMKTNFYRPKSDLEEHSASIEQYFRDHPPSSIAEATAKIEELTGIRRSHTQVRKFLNRLGMRYRKTSSIPCNADPDVQDEFKKKL